MSVCHSPQNPLKFPPLPLAHARSLLRHHLILQHPPHTVHRFRRQRHPAHPLILERRIGQRHPVGHHFGYRLGIDPDLILRVGVGAQAREAASIVLLDDDFGSIVATVRLGRRIYDNLRKAMSFILAVHVPIAGLALIPLAMGMPLLFGPVHIAFLEMVIDPVCALVFDAETEEDGVMDRPPRPVSEALFSTPTIIWSLLQGGLVVQSRHLMDRV